MSSEQEGDIILLPAGYGRYEYEGYPMLGNRNEEFFVANRSFEMIDGFFSQEISNSIQTLRAAKPDKKVRILDLAGGIESQAVKDIKEQFGDSVQAVNIDFAHNVQKGQGAERIQGDATRLPIADACIDIIYSRQFLPFLRRFSSKHKLQVEKVLSEIARVLTPGGIAFIDDEGEISGTKLENNRKALEDKLGVTLETHESIYGRVKRKFPKFWKEEIKPAKFLVMKKPLNNA